MKFAFDYDEFFNEKLESTAILMWNTHYQTFTLAFYLNQLYGLCLQRLDNITIEQKTGPLSCTIYSCCNNADQTSFFLIDNPQQAESPNIFDKTLLIIGPESQELAQHIHHEIDNARTGNASTSDAPADSRQAMLVDFVLTGIFENALFDFSDPDNPLTTYFQNTDPNPTLQKKQQRFLKQQRQYVSDLIYAIEPLLPDYETE